MKRRSFLSISSLAAIFSPVQLSRAAYTGWRKAAPLPINTQELYAAVHEGKIYLAGGIAAKAGLPYFVASCFSYDPVLNTWSEEHELPENTHHAAMVSSKDQLYQIGGFNGSYAHVWRMRGNAYRLSGEGWLAAVDLPKPQAEGVLATAPDDAIHLVAGQSPRGKANKARSDHIETHKHWRWDTSTNSWEAAAPIPTARNSATGGWIDRNLIVTGGRTAKGNLAITEIYDGQEDKWRTASPMPLPQAGTASVIVGSRLIVIGGEIFVPQEGVFPNVWSYDLQTDRWSPLPNLATPRHGLAASYIDGHIYAIGGATKPSGNGTSDLNEVLRLD